MRVSVSNFQFDSSALSLTLLISVCAPNFVSTESNICDKLSLRQYMGCDISQTLSNCFPRFRGPYCASQSRCILDAIIDAIVITESWGLTPTAVGNTLASQTKRFPSPCTRQFESTTESAASAPILFPDCGCADPKSRFFGS